MDGGQGEGGRRDPPIARVGGGAGVEVRRRGDARDPWAAGADPGSPTPPPPPGAIGGEESELLASWGGVQPGTDDGGRTSFRTGSIDRRSVTAAVRESEMGDSLWSRRGAHSGLQALREAPPWIGPRRVMCCLASDHYSRGRYTR